MEQRKRAIETFLECAEKRGNKVYHLSDPVEAMAYRQEIRKARLEREKQQEQFQCKVCGGGDFTCTCGT